MTRPFPGMDPYLEEPKDWPGVHSRLIAVLGEMLAAKVGPRFFVASETSIYLVSPEDYERRVIVPDLYLTERPEQSPPRLEGGVITEPLRITPVFPAQFRQHYLEIRERDSRRVVTTIELVSPINKTPGTNGFDEFWRKRQRIMRSSTHWIEIDLLRAGQRPPEIRGRSDYYALLKRGESEPPQRGDAERPLDAWPFFNLRDRLPTIAVPLTKPLPDVPLDLQAALDTVYARYHYENGVNYDSPPPLPAFNDADRRWLAERLQEWRICHAGQENGER